MVDAAAERLILVIDQNPDHIRIIESTLEDSQGNYRMVAIADGSEALDFLYRRGQHETAPRPDLILLDLHQSQPDGLEILSTIKANDQLRRIPIIMFTASDQPEHILRSYALQGNCYVLKSDDLGNLAAIVKRIEEFWLGIVTLPVE
jgi:chemotaxis family two-component system response regulator Rcp1